jgi:hypothetical protein
MVIDFFFWADALRGTSGPPRAADSVAAPAAFMNCLRVYFFEPPCFMMRLLSVSKRLVLLRQLCSISHVNIRIKDFDISWRMSGSEGIFVARCFRRQRSEDRIE